MTTPTNNRRHTRGLWPFPIVATAASQLVFAGDWYLAGWSLRESTGAAVADFDLMDGQSNDGLVVATFNLAINGVHTQNTGGRPITLRQGLWLQVNSGSVRGAVWAMDRNVVESQAFDYPDR